MSPDPVPPRGGARRAAIAFIFVTVVLDVLAFGIIIPVLPKLVEDFLGGNTARAAEIYGLFGTIRERLTGTRVPETTARYLRLTIQNLDDRPLTVTGARVFAVKRTIVFEATPGRAYVLDYGNPSATTPRYDVARAPGYLGGERLPEATLGSVQRVPAPPPPPWLASQPIVMWASMAMAVLTLGSLLWRMARGVRAGG